MSWSPSHGGHDAVGLEGGVGVDGAVVGRLVDDLGLGEALLDVAAVRARPRRGPTTLPLRGTSSPAGASLAVEDERARRPPSPRAARG